MRIIPQGAAKRPIARATDGDWESPDAASPPTQVGIDALRAPPCEEIGRFNGFEAKIDETL